MQQINFCSRNGIFVYTVLLWSTNSRRASILIAPWIKNGQGEGVEMYNLKIQSFNLQKRSCFLSARFESDINFSELFNHKANANNNNCMVHYRTLLFAIELFVSIKIASKEFRIPCLKKKKINNNQNNNSALISVKTKIGNKIEENHFSR